MQGELLVAACGRTIRGASAEPRPRPASSSPRAGVRHVSSRSRSSACRTSSCRCCISASASSSIFLRSASARSRPCRKAVLAAAAPRRPVGPGVAVAASRLARAPCPPRPALVRRPRGAVDGRVQRAVQQPIQDVRQHHEVEHLEQECPRIEVSWLNARSSG